MNYLINVFNFFKDRLSTGELYLLGLILFSWYCVRSAYKIKLTGYKYTELDDFAIHKISKCIDEMDGVEFEDFIAFLYNRLGHKVIQTAATRDGGYDMILDHNTLVEIKHFSEGNRVGRPILQKLIGACVENDIDKGLIITTSSFTKEAHETIKKCTKVNIEVVYKEDILRMCKKINSSEILEWLGFDKNEICHRYEY